MANFPGPRRRGLFRNKKLSALTTACGSGTAAVLLLYRAISGDDGEVIDRAAELLGPISPHLAAQLVKIETRSSVTILAIVGGLVAFVVALHAVVTAWLENSDAADQRDPNHLLAPLLLLELMVRKKRGYAQDDRTGPFRATLHKVTKAEHVQCVPYVGWPRGENNGGCGRKWSNRSGLVGNVIRTKGDERGEPLIANVPSNVTDEQKYRQMLVKSWGYDEKEANSHASMRLSSLAVPICDRDSGDRNVIGVLYCDSSIRDFFDIEIVEMCVLTAQAIALHVRLAS